MTEKRFYNSITGAWECKEGNKSYFFKFEELEMYERENGHWHFTDNWSIEENNGNVKSINFYFLNLISLALDYDGKFRVLNFRDINYPKICYHFETIT
jgi:hypothetical protein